MKSVNESMSYSQTMSKKLKSIARFENILINAFTICNGELVYM